MTNPFEKFFKSKKQSPVGTYRVDVVSLPEELDFEQTLPAEIRFILKRFPEYKDRIRTILSQGKAIGIRTLLRTPENILKAIHTITVHTQGNYILTWLPELLRNKHLPKFSDEDKRVQLPNGENLVEAVETILRDRLRFKRLVLIDEENIGIKNEEQRLMTELSELIYPLAVDYSVFRVIADNARERTHVAQSIIKALLIIGPIAHVLEKFASGVGKVFAASADDLLGEAAELSALRGSGFSWKELSKRGIVLVPVFGVATFGAFSVEPLLESHKIILAGAVFGLSAVALSLTTAFQSVFMYRKNLAQLISQGKFRQLSPWETTILALKQDFTNPARLGLLIGAGLAPVMGILGAILNLLHNGWILAAIGSTESIVAALTVIFADRISEWRFKKKLEQMRN